MTNTINDGSYAQYDDWDLFSMKCIDYLMDNDETIWKLLKYNTPDAWQKTDLTIPEKRALIYDGVADDTSLYHVFMDMGQPDVETSETCIIRIHPYSLNAPNRVVGTIMMMFEVYANYKINHLTNNRTRNDMIMKRFLQVFNGATIGGIGKLNLDTMGSYGSRLETGGQLPFRGKWLLMGNKST